MIRKLPLPPKNVILLGKYFQYFSLVAQTKSLDFRSEHHSGNRYALKWYRTNFSKFHFVLKINIPPLKKLKNKRYPPFLLSSPGLSVCLTEEKEDGLYRFLTVIWPSLQKERVSCSWLKGFCSLTKLKPYSPASSTLDERRWGQQLSYSYPPRNSMKVGPSQMNCATCLRRFMEAGTGECSLHTNEVSKKYLA